MKAPFLPMGVSGLSWPKKVRKNTLVACSTMDFQWSCQVIVPNLMYEKNIAHHCYKRIRQPHCSWEKSFKKVCASYHQHDIVLQEGSEFLDESYLKKTHFGSVTGTERTTSNMMAVQPTPAKETPHFRSLQKSIQSPEIIWVTFLSWGVCLNVFFLLGDGTWNRFSWHEETGRNFVSEMSVFPPHRNPFRTPIRAAMAAWLRWSGLHGVSSFLQCLFFQWFQCKKKCHWITKENYGIEACH